MPPAGEGRYIAAGRYVAIANELGIPINNLTAILNERHGRPHRYWRVGTSDSTQPRNRWAIMRDNHCVAIGWLKLGDLSGIMHDKNSKEKIRIDMETHYPKTPQQVGRATQQVFNFVSTIGEGDVVIAADGATVLGIGKITGGYTFAPSFDFPHCLPVEWLSLEEWHFPTIEGLQTTVHEFKNNANKVEIEKRILEAPPIISKPANRSQKPSLPHRLGGLLGRIQSVLERKGQVILYGPPGTGKTHWAVMAAHELAAHSNFGVSFDELLNEQERLVRADDPLKSFVRMCCFHPAYGYEDFLEGYRPDIINSQMSFVLRDGIFKKLCKDAQSMPERKFYLIIDEINRGDIPRIFGELLTVLEKNKRGTSILLPLTGTVFQVPDNVCIIGTMNTADRSIALLDTALRRRFGFIELMPDSAVLGDAAAAGIPLGPWLDALNRRICEYIGRDSRNLQIGHSYLLDKSHPITDFARFFKIIQDDIVPLLEEYCYEDYTKLEKILGKGLVDSHNLRIRHELFDAAKQDELVQALLAPCPEIASTSQAMASEVKAFEDENDEIQAAGEEE